MIRPTMLRTAARPFVTRALRGGRVRRIAGLGLLLTALSGVLGTWLAVGTGTFERELRHSFRLEDARWEQEMTRFVLIADGEEEAAALRRQVELQSQRRHIDVAGFEEEFRVRNAIEGAAATLRNAALSEAPRTGRELQERARLTWGTWSNTHDAWSIDGRFGPPSFNWYDKREVTALRSILDRGVVPEVEVYASPLGPLDALRFTGVLAGGALLLLLLLAAPVLAGTQMAQETHENTLQPLTGSALRSEELAVGLTSGPLAVTALLAAPQLALLMVAALVVGAPAAALGFVASALAGGAFLVMLAQLAGLGLGKLRSPGLVGGGLAALFGILGGVGLALAADLTPRTVGTLALLPQAAAGHALGQTFGLGDGEPGFGAAVDSTAPVLIGTLGMLTFAYLGLRALARRIGQSTPSALGAGEALIAAALAMVLVTCANPYQGGWRAEEFYLLNLGLLSVPMGILLMMRAPTGDAPRTLRRPTVGRLVAEFFGWAGLSLAAGAVIAGPDHMHVLQQPVALAYLVWFLGVAALLALRVVMAPLTFASRLWVGVCAAALMVAFGHTVMWARSADELLFRTPSVFVFSELSPFLGAVQAILTAVIPWTLWRALRRAAAVRGEG